MTSGLRFRLLLGLFFLSGASGLAYQVLWLRRLALVFGVTVYAAGTVLAAFMTGLGLGSLLAGPLLRRWPRPLLLFGAAEVLVGLSALSTPLALDATARLYEGLYGAASDRLWVLTVARFASSFPVLLVPTLLMGLTFPLLSASGLVRSARFGSRLGWLYAVNTMGALTGAAATGFVLIGALGLRSCFLLAASFNVAVGAAALAMGRGARAEDEVASPALDAGPAAQGPAVQPGLAAALAVVIAASGLASFALEVVWFRMLAQFLDATTYAFSTMLATVLAGIAAGGALASVLLRRPRNWPLWLVALQPATAVAVVASAAFLSWTYAAGWRTAAAVPASAAAIFPAALLMGLAFPIALRAALPGGAEGEAAATGGGVGRLYALNVGGAVAGSLLGGFVLLPWLGTRRALVAAAALYVAAGLWLALRAAPRRPALLAAGAGLFAFALLAARVPDPFEAAFGRRHGTDLRELFRHDGAQTAVSVRQGPSQRVLFLDGLHQANDTAEMVRLHRTIGHLPMVLHPDPREVLVVGLGGGATAGAVSRHPGVQVQVVELSEGVRQAAAFFSHISYDVLRDPAVRLRVDDGRNFLRFAGARFDVVTADIIQPHHAGAGHLYSREYFRLVRDALREDGLALQWLGDPARAQYRLIMRTFLEVFPEATLWYGGELMVGSRRPLRLRPGRLAALRARPETAAALDEVGLHDFETLARWYTAGPREMAAFVGEGPVLTDDRPLAEYYRSLPRRRAPADPSLLRGDVSALVAGEGGAAERTVSPR